MHIWVENVKLKMSARSSAGGAAFAGGPVISYCGAEMRLRVKEHVVNKKDDHELPKNIRQVGEVDLDKRVYIEDYAFSFVKEIALEEDEEGRVGILLGEDKTIDGETYTFVYGAMEVMNASVYDGRVSFTQETWSLVNTNRNTYFEGMAIVGWYLVSSTIRPERNAELERTHADSFGRYKALMYVNPAEKTEEMYSCFDGGLECLDGYVIYFDKNEQMQKYMAEVGSQRRLSSADEMVMKRYRQVMRESKNEPKAKQQLSIMYALSAVLVIFVLVAGAARLQSEKNTGSDSVVTEDGGDYVEDNAPVNGTPAATEDETLNVDYANGNVNTTEGTQEEISSEPASSDGAGTDASAAETEPAAEETTAEETTAEETTTAEPETTTQAHRTYVVQEGDTLYGIIKREYGSEDQAKLQELFELNGITDGGNSIAPGDELLLP